MRSTARTVLFLSFSLIPALGGAQVVQVGTSGLYIGDRNPPGVETDFNFSSPALLAGRVTQAAFGWSNGPCPAAAMIKFFRPTNGNPQSGFTFLTERGPFDVTQTERNPGPFYVPPFQQGVALIPPVSLQPGDIIAITNLTSCGGPVFELSPLHPPFPEYSFSVPGDVHSDVQTPATFASGLYLYANGDGSEGLLLLDRFFVTLEATDPRTGRTTRGVANSLGSAAGYFSLPEFTRDPSFPEVMVKMVDATSSPSLGGTFWFFHAPLTDSQYTLTVFDESTGAQRTYSNGSGTSDQLCGGADTSAFFP